MSKTTLRAGTTSPFAHLLAAFRPRSSRADQGGDPADKSGKRAEDDPDDPDDDQEARKARRAEEDEQRQQEDARRAEEDDRRQQEDARRAEEDEADPEDKKPDGKKAKADDGDDEDDGAEEDETEKKAEDEDDDDDMCRARREGFAAAQARGRRIFSAPEAAKRPDVAAHLAFDETMPSAKAIAMLKLAANGELPAPSGSRLGRRMSKVVIPNPGTGGSGASSEEKSFGAIALAAAKKAGIAK